MTRLLEVHQLGLVDYSATWQQMRDFTDTRDALTPDQLIYSEGTRMWPSSFTFANFGTVLFQTDFLSYFSNSVIVSSARGPEAPFLVSSQIRPLTVPSTSEASSFA